MNFVKAFKRMGKKISMEGAATLSVAAIANTYEEKYSGLLKQALLNNKYTPTVNDKKGSSEVFAASVALTMRLAETGTVLKHYFQASNDLRVRFYTLLCELTAKEVADSNSVADYYDNIVAMKDDEVHAATTLFLIERILSSNDFLRLKSDVVTLTILEPVGKGLLNSGTSTLNSLDDDHIITSKLES